MLIYDNRFLLNPIVFSYFILCQAQTIFSTWWGRGRGKIKLGNFVYNCGTQQSESCHTCCAAHLLPCHRKSVVWPLKDVVSGEQVVLWVH